MIAKPVVEWIRRENLTLLVLALVSICGTWILLEVGDELTEGSEHDLDRWLLQAVRRSPGGPEPIGPAWLQTAARDMTALGGYAVLTLVTAAAAIFLGLIKKHSAGLLLIGGTLGGWVAMRGLKALFQHPRPFIVPGIAEGDSASFPSGHAMLSAIVYLTLGSILACFIKERRLQNYVIAVALAVTLLVGASRVYLGVHYPTDVLAGWSLGLSWGILCMVLTRRLVRGGIVT